METKDNVMKNRYEITIVIGNSQFRSEFFHKDDFDDALDNVRKSGYKYLAFEVSRRSVKYD